MQKMQFLSKFRDTKKLKKIATHSYAKAYCRTLENFFGPEAGKTQKTTKISDKLDENSTLFLKFGQILRK